MVLMRLYTENDEILLSDNKDNNYDDEYDNDDSIENMKVVVPIPDYDMSIHDIMNDDIMEEKNQSGYHQFENISMSFDDKKLDDIQKMIHDIENDNDNDDDDDDRNIMMHTHTVTGIIQHIKQEPVQHYMNITNEDYNSDNENVFDIKTMERRMMLLQNINISLKQQVKQQMKQVEILKNENLQIKNQFEEYKLTHINENENENE
eukprot:28915_1